MTLYWIKDELFGGYSMQCTEVVKETEQMYMLNGAAESKWITRLNKQETGCKGFYFSADDAWNAFVQNAEANVRIEERRLENAREHLQNAIKARSLANA